MQYENSVGSSPIVVVDASVWISSVLTTDRFHFMSDSWLAWQTRPAAGVVLPSIALAEIGGAIGRVADDEVLARAVVNQIKGFASVRIDPVDVDLAADAADLAIELRLRGADAVYVALAARLSLPLVTWDREMLERAGGRIEVRVPAAV